MALPTVTGYPQERELRAMPLMKRLAHARNAAMVEDKEAIEAASDLIDALVEALRAVTDHFADVMAGPLVAGHGITFKDGIDGIPTIKQARKVLADMAQG